MDVSSILIGFSITYHQQWSFSIDDFFPTESECQLHRDPSRWNFHHAHRLWADSGLIGNRVGPKVGYPVAKKKTRHPWDDCIFTYMDGWFLWCSLVNIPLYTWILCLSGVKTKKHITELHAIDIETVVAWLFILTLSSTYKPGLKLVDLRKLSWD